MFVCHFTVVVVIVQIELTVENQTHRLDTIRYVLTDNFTLTFLFLMFQIKNESILRRVTKFSKINRINYIDNNIVFDVLVKVGLLVIVVDLIEKTVH